MKEMLVTLGNEAGFSPSEHFERLAQCGAIKSFEFGGGEDEYLKRAQIVLADGVECTVTVIVSGERTDITTLRLGGSADFDAEGFRRFAVAIERLVPFLAISFASLSNARLGGCSSALRRDLV